MAVQNPPAGYHSVTPYLVIAGADAALAWYGRAFGAVERLRLPMPGADGGERIAHAEMQIGDSVLMLSDEWPDMGLLGPRARGGPTASLMIYVDDADAMFAQAVAAGASEERPVTLEFYGDRAGTLVDPFGHRWTIATHVEDVPPEEMERRMAAYMAGA